MDELLNNLNKYGRFSIMPISNGVVSGVDYTLIQHREEGDDVIRVDGYRETMAFIAGMIYAIERSELI